MSAPTDFDRESRLPRFSLDRRITVLVLLVTLLVLGAVATLSIPVELFPSGYTAPHMNVSVPWRDAPSQEVLDKIVLPLEEELSTVAGIDRLDSYARTGYANVSLTFKHGTDMAVAYREVRDRVERARVVMPDDLQQVFIRKEDASGIPIYFLGLAVDPAVIDVYNLVQDEIVLPLSRIDGVASVQTNGLAEKEVLIELDRERTAAAGLNIYDLAQQLGADNFTLSSGSVMSGGRKLLLRSVARYDSVEELQARLVAPQVRLGDIADISYDLPEYNFRVRAMSRPAIALAVMKEGDANTLEVAERVDAVVEELRQNPRLRVIELATLFDQGDVIMESLATLLDSGKVGGLIALLVLLFFLRRFRMTLIVTLSIPLSIVIALTVMYFAGESLNILTLLALMISVGLLVDNSVVVAENIFRLHREGLSPRRACIEGAGEIALAIVMATLTTIIVFLPVSLVDGMGQFFLLRLSIPISVALLGSLLVALVFIPLSVFLTLPRQGANGKPHPVFDWLQRAYELTFGFLNRGYTKLLRFFLVRRLDLVLALGAVFLVTAGLVFREVEFVEVADEERGGFEIDVDLPNNTTLEEAEEYFLQAEAIIESKAEELDLDGWFLFHRATFGELQGWFKNPRTNKITPREATRIVMEAIPERAGVRLYTGEEAAADEGKKQSLHTFVLEGEDSEILETVAESLEELFLSVDGVIGMKKVADESPSEMALVLDRERMQAQGINPYVVSAVVGYALRGQGLPRFRRNGKEIPVTVRFKEEDRDSLEELSDFGVPTEDGASVSLASLAEPRYLTSSRRIFRNNKRTSRTITLELEEDREQETRQRLTALAAVIDLPEGVRFGGGGGRGMSEDLQAMAFAAVVSVIFIYLLMGFLFESFILPLSIILTIPLASLGVYWGHFLMGRNIDFLGVVGLILLIGVVVNNGIVLIDYVTRLRHAGRDRSEALLLAAERRFRPIMMTAMTTIGGMIPLTVGGSTSIGLSYKSFGLTLIGGLTTATLLTLLVVPVFYTFFDDAREVMTRVARRALGRDRRPGVPGAEAETA
ncbi:MAG: efflux RND transporter permease subunit [Thermoanaerobaculia bacterium]|nr:efflux RND transporter permease subunit [Thermoanaerobaculia bacterium]